jgi:hypothetical protein
VAQLPEGGPPGALLGFALAAGARVQQPHREADQPHRQPHRQHRGGVHADRAGQQPPRLTWPGQLGVVQVVRQLGQDRKHVDQPDRQVLVGAEADGGDLAD